MSPFSVGDRVVDLRDQKGVVYEVIEGWLDRLYRVRFDKPVPDELRLHSELKPEEGEQ